jgi:class 3 adenylate cyclase/tetratricopeptide (TPR) repeat protein
VTVLFACVSGLLELSEQLELEEARRLINACLESLSGPVYKYGGTLDKFVGKEIMAVFGAPEVHEDDAERALCTALEMARALDRFNETERTHLPAPLSLGCGINTGLVFAGEVGALGQEAYSVMGDAVNLANRLAYLAEPGQILVGEHTYLQAASSFDFHPLPAIRVRGKLEPVPVKLLLGERDRSARGLRMAGLISPLVGRTEEMDLLRSRIHRLRDGQGGTILLMGEAGLGKSRMVAELRSLEQDLRWLEGRSSPYGTHEPLSPFRDLLLRWTGVEERTGDDARERVSEALERALPEQADAVYPFFLHVLDIQPDPQTAEMLAALSAEGVYTRTLAAMRSFFSGLAHSQPTVVVMEDLHWADRSSVELLRRLLPLSTEAPLLFLLVARETPFGVPGLDLQLAVPEDEAHTELELVPLSQEETSVLISNLLGDSQVPPALQDHIRRKAEGNPLFVEEIIRALMQEGALVQEDGQWKLTRAIQKIEIPNTLRGLLTSRIDKLGAEVKDTLSQAAVIGRVFAKRLLASVARDEGFLDEHLRILLENNFIRYYTLQDEEERAYIFDHGLTQEAAYEAIVTVRRIAIHRRVLEAMEQADSGYQDQYGALAHHATVGEVWDKAAHYLHAAGDRAKAAWALPEAARYYEQATEVVREHAVELSRDELADLYHECSSAHTMLGEYDAARTVSQGLMDLAETLDDSYLRGHAFHSAAVVAAHSGDTATLVQSARRACDELQAAGADWNRGVALLALAQGQIRSGDLDGAQASVKEGLRLVGDARRWPGYDPRGEASFNAGLVALLKGELEEAATFFEQTRDFAARAGEQLFVGVSHGFAGLTFGFQGDYELALRCLEDGRRVGESADIPLATFLCAACAAWVHAMVGRYGSSLHLTAFASDERQAESRDARAIALLSRGDAYIGLQDPERGLAAYQNAFEVAGLAHVVTVPAMRGIGLAYLRLGQVEQGMASLGNAVNFATFGGLRWFRAQALRDLVWAHLQTGDRVIAANLAEELLELAESAGYREMVGWGHLLRGQAAAGSSDLREALAIGQELGCLSLVWEAGEALAEDDPQVEQVVASAVRTIAADLPQDARRDFVAHKRVNRFISH